MKSLNIKEFKKISGDERHTVLRSPKGHSITILHKPLAKAHADALKALPIQKLADGGVIRNAAQKYLGDDPAQGDEITPTGSPIDLVAGGLGAGLGRAMAGDAAGVIANEVGSVGPSVKSAAYLPNMTQQAVNEAVPVGEGMASNAAGTAAKQAADAQAKARAVDFAQRLAKQKASSRYADGGPVQKYADGTPDAPVEQAAAPRFIDTPVAPDPTQTMQLPANNQAGVAPVAADQPPAQDAAPSPVAAPTQAAPTQPPTPATPPPAPSDPFGDAAALEGGLLNKGIGEQKAGLTAAAAAEGELGKKQAAIQAEQAQQTQAALGSYQGKLNQLDQEHAKYLSDLQNGHIDPNRLINNMSTGQHILTGIGIFLGGLGAGLSHSNSNAALDFLNKQIDRDIDAQRADLGKTENLLSVNMRQYGNVRDAMDATRVQLQAAGAAKLQQASDAATDPIVKARAMQGAGALDANSAANFGALRQRQGLGAALSNTAPGVDNTPGKIQMLRLLGHEDLAKNLEQRYVPGAGVASTPVPQEIRDKITAKKTFGDMAQNFYDWSKDHSGSLDPKTVAEGKTKAAEMQSLYRNSINGGVFKKGEQDFIDNIVDSDPTKFFNSVRVLPKLQEVIRSNNVQQGILHKSVGLPAPQPAQPATPQYKISNGIKYMRGPNGEAIAVK